MQKIVPEVKNYNYMGSFSWTQGTRPSGVNRVQRLMMLLQEITTNSTIRKISYSQKKKHNYIEA